MATVEYDYDEMQNNVDKLEVLQLATIGLQQGYSESAISGMFEIIRDIRHAINPDNHIQKQGS